MLTEDELVEQIKKIEDLAEKDKKIDSGALIANLLAMQNQSKSSMTGNEKVKAYMVSVLFPPFGLIYAVKFFTRRTQDSKNAAILCVILTIASSLLLIAIAKSAFSSLSGLGNLQNIDPNSLYQ